MSKKWLAILTLATACGLPISVHAQTHNSASTVVGRVTGNLFSGPDDVGFNSGQQSAIDYDGGAVLFVNESEAIGGAEGGGIIEGAASPGRLRVRIVGLSTAKSFGEYAATSVTASATFFDTFSILRNRPGAADIPLGTVMILNGSFELHGTMEARGTGRLSNSYTISVPDHQNAMANVTLKISGVGNTAPYANGVYASQTHGYQSLFPQTVRGLTYYNQPAQQRISYEKAFLWGYPNVIDVGLHLIGLATVENNLAGASDPTPQAEFLADYSHTLTWGGISSITRYDTGEVLTDWTVASSSGFDYSRPAVPEPAGRLLAAAAALALSRVRPKPSLA